jgi:hypothetical protein
VFGSLWEERERSNCDCYINIWRVESGGCLLEMEMEMGMGMGMNEDRKEGREENEGV